MKNNLTEAAMNETIKQAVLDAYENAAMKGLKAITDFLAYEGGSPDYFKKARIGAVPVSSFTRILATKANMDSLAQKNQ